MTKKKQLSPDTPKQLSMLDAIEKLEHWEHIRRIEIDGVMHFSILDIFKFYGSTKNYQREWTQVQAMLEKQGFSSSTEIVQLQFEGERQRKTPIATFEVFLRIAQVTTFKHWEHIRRMMSSALAEKLESAQMRKLRNEIEKHDKWGLGDKPEIVLLKARLENKIGYEALKEIVAILCEKPQWGQLNNAIYTALFGMVAEELKSILGTKSIRDSLPLRQLQALTLGEGVLTDMLAMQNDVTMQRIMDCIDIAIKPIGAYLQWYSQNVGISHVTGKPLLNATN